MIKNPNIDRIIEFVSKFAVSLSSMTATDKTLTNEKSKQAINDETMINNQTTENQTTTEEIENPFLVALVNYLLSVKLFKIN